MRNHLTLFFLILLGLLACNNNDDENTNPEGFEFGVPFILEFEQTENSTDGQLAVTFAEVVSDSRCPSDVVCVWEGECSVRLALTFGDLAGGVTLSTHPDFGPVDTVANFIYTLIEVSPYPVSTEVLQPEDYTIEASVKEL